MHLGDIKSELHDIL